MLLHAVDELIDNKCISDATWAAPAQQRSRQQLIDLVFAAGQYTLVSMALNTFGVALDAGVPGFPTGGSTAKRRPGGCRADARYHHRERAGHRGDAGPHRYADGHRGGAAALGVDADVIRSGRDRLVPLRRRQGTA